jgi:uncharacterized membrane protein
MADKHQWSRDESTGQYVQDVSVWVNAPVETCFGYWSQFEMFPKIMHYIESVEKTGTNTWHWRAKIGGQRVEWDATMPDYRQNDIISWRSTDGLKNSGAVNFIPQNNGTRIEVHLMYDPPYGIVGDIAAQATMNDQLHNELVEDLNRFKTAVESGQTEQFRPAA